MFGVGLSLSLMALPVDLFAVGVSGAVTARLEVRSAHAAEPKKPRPRRTRARSVKAPKSFRSERARDRRLEAEAPRSAAPLPDAELVRRGPTRIDFDDRLIQGQTNQSGAVVLFARKASGLRSMVERRKSFRERTLRTIFDR